MIIFNLDLQQIESMAQTISFICGAIAGFTQFILGQPLDYFKIKYQTTTPSPQTKFANILQSTFKQQGLMGYLKGSLSMIVGMPLIVGTQFMLYEKVKSFYMKAYTYNFGQTPQEILNLRHIGMSGLISGAAISLLSCPIQYLKIQKQTNENRSRSLPNNFNFINMYKGFMPTLLRQSIGGFAYFYTYEMVVRKICQLRGSKRRFAYFSDFLIGGGAAGLSYWTLAYPWDGIKTRIQSKVTLNNNQVQSSLKFLYRGYPIAALRAVLVNSVSFALYEQIKGTSQLIMAMAVV